MREKKNSKVWGRKKFAEIGLPGEIEPIYIYISTFGNAIERNVIKSPPRKREIFWYIGVGVRKKISASKIMNYFTPRNGVVPGNRYFMSTYLTSSQESRLVVS
jgi:hypothetical protein